MRDLDKFLTGRVQAAGLGGMIHYYEYTTEGSILSNENIFEKWEYIFKLIKERFTWISPQKVGESCICNALSEIEPDCIFKYYDIITTDTDNVSPDFRELFIHELEERLPKEIVKDFSQQEIDETAVRKVIHIFIGSLGKEDRLRISEEKLYWLALFVYDFCNSFYRDALIDADLLKYIEDRIVINGETFSVSKAERIAIIDKLKTPCVTLMAKGPDGQQYPVEFQDYELSFKDGVYRIQHPKNTPLYKSIMFMDLMHSFFLSYGLKKRLYKGKPAEFNTAEKALIFELLVQLKFCNSKKNAKESKYVDDLFSHQTYLKDCEVLTWIRCNAYGYLLPITADVLYGDIFKQSGIQAEEDVPTEKYPAFNDFFSDICGYRLHSELVMGHSFKCIHSDNNFARMIETGNGGVLQGFEDNPLEYVYSLLTNRFSFLQVLPMGPPSPIAKYIITKQEVFQVLEQTIASELIGRENEIATNPLMIPHYSTTAEDIKRGLMAAIPELLGNDGERIEIDKLYYLVLFISDYCTQVFKIAELHPVYKRRHHKTIDVDGKKILTSIEMNDLILSYLKRPINTYYYLRDEKKTVYGPRNGQLYPPPRVKRRHPQYDTKNYIAMFCDLFRSFLRSFGTIHREGAGLSDMDKRFIASILQTLGYKKASEGIISSYLAERRDYFRKCKLYDWLREGPYSDLFLNDMDEELFTSKDNNDDGDDCNESSAPQLAEN